MQVVNFVKTHLGARLAIMFIIMSLIPIAVVGLLSFQRAGDSLRDLALGKVEQEAALTTKDMSTFLGQFSSDLLALSTTPPVQGIIRARDNGGIDPVSNDKFEVWVNRLTQIFKANAQNKGFYQQLRYINEVGDA